MGVAKRSCLDDVKSIYGEEVAQCVSLFFFLTKDKK